MNKIEELNKKKVMEEEAKKKKEQEKVPQIKNLDIQEQIISAIQNLDGRLKDVEAALFRVRSSI